MYDFQFLISEGKTLAEALSNVRGLFKQAFPVPGDIHVVSTNVTVNVIPGKLHGQFIQTFLVVLTVDSSELIVADIPETTVDVPRMPMRPVKE